MMCMKIYDLEWLIYSWIFDDVVYGYERVLSRNNVS